MNTTLLRGATFALVAFAGFALADTAPEHHILTSGAAIKWGPPPPVLMPGAKFAVIDGDPAAQGLVTVRLIMPPGYKIAPHWHPTDEHVTVLAGSFVIAMGDTFETAHGKVIKAGGYAVAPANMHHYAWTKTGATIQVHLNGPFAINYVNPADDPRQSPKK